MSEYQNEYLHAEAVTPLMMFGDINITISYLIKTDCLRPASPKVWASLTRKSLAICDKWNSLNKQTPFQLTTTFGEPGEKRRDTQTGGFNHLLQNGRRYFGYLYHPSIHVHCTVIHVYHPYLPTSSIQVEVGYIADIAYDMLIYRFHRHAMM